MGSEQHVCPDCGQPVETVVRRHKTLGAWVPVWVPGPCRNPECATHADAVARSAEGAGAAGAGRAAEAEKEPGRTAARNP
ncbi:hypothetical protein [Streptomyces sp. NPDC052701]|uniref:hypothetical protein n=1 Tax=Streptomyces sp. NPDC052701 TaxID=3155533 RepID=UPI0034289F6E